MKSCSLNTLEKATLSNGDELLLPCIVNYYYIDTDEKTKEAVEEILPLTLDSKNMLAIDVETNGLDPYLNDILLLQIGTKENIQYIFDYRKITPELLKPILEGDYWKLGHNIKFDAKFIKNKLNIEFNKFYDTFLAEKVIRGGSFITGNGGYALDELIKYRVGTELKLNTLSFAKQNLNIKVARVKKQMQESFLKMKSEEFNQAQLAYAAQDVSGETIFKIVERQIEILLKENTNILYDPEAAYITNPLIKNEYEKLFNPTLRLWETAKLEFKFLEVVIDLELYGIEFDLDIHKKVLENIDRDYKEYRLEFLKLLGKNIPQKTLLGTASVNPDSSKQVLAALNSLKLKLTDTSSEDLEAKLRELNPKTESYKIVESLLNYRTMSKLVQSFGLKLAQHIHPQTGRIHYEVQQILETGRMSTYNPNLQQIPAKITCWKKTGDLQKDQDIKLRDGLRECFAVKSGRTLIMFDYDSQELRVVASVSRDSHMLQAFKQNKNLHCYSATLMYDEDYEEFYAKFKAGDPDAKAKRTEAKTVSFGALYGSGAPNLARVLNICIEKAKDILDRFWYVYTELKNSMTRYGEVANKIGYSNTILGRRRYYTHLLERIKWVKLDNSIASIEAKAREEGMEWLFEKEPTVTKENIHKFKEALIRKFSNNISRQAGNHVVQGSSADITKLASINIRKEFKNLQLDAKIVGLVHDEIIVECLDSIAEQCSSIVESKMKEAMLQFCPNIPPAVDGKIYKSWKK